MTLIGRRFTAPSPGPAQLGTLELATRLAGNPDLLQRLRTPELLHQDSRGQPQSAHPVPGLWFCVHVTLRASYTANFRFPPQAIIKPQYVDQIPKAVKGTVARIMENKDERKVREEIFDVLGIWLPSPDMRLSFS